MPGKQEAFSPEENRALRAALRKLKEEQELTQADLGRILGIKQQNAGRLVGHSSGVGMGRATAMNLARHLGYRNAEDFLLELGVASSLTEAPQQHPLSNRETAVRIARLQQYPHEVIEAVVKRFTSADDLNKPLTWWAARFANELAEIAVDALSAKGEAANRDPLASTQEAPRAKPAARGRPRRKRAS